MFRLLRKIKIILIVLLITAFSACLYIMVDMGSMGDIISMYESLGTNVGKNVSKKIQFLESYTQVSGDLTLALNKGLSEDDIGDILEGGSILDPSDDDPGESGIIRPALTGTWAEQINLMATSGSSDAGHYNTQNFKVVNVNGCEFIFESQNAQYPQKYGGTKSIKGAGCFLFAMSSIISNKTGTIVSVADMLSKNGSTVTFDDAYSYNYPANSKFNLVGSIESVKNILSMYNINNGLTEIVTAGSAKDGKSFVIDVQNAIDNGKYVLYYCEGGQGVLASSGGEGYHWTVIVGYDDNNFHFLCNGARDVGISKVTAQSLCRHAWVIE